MAKAAPAAAAAAAKARNKTDVLNSVAESTGLTKKQVQAVLDAVKDEMGKDLGKKGPGAFTVPGICKVTVQRKPATKEREGTNPFTGEKTIFKAKPARNVVKMRPLKAVKDLV